LSAHAHKQDLSLFLSSFIAMVSCWSNPTTKDAYRLALASIIIESLAGAGGCALYVVTGSSLALVYGLENIVDFLSSTVVLWRFFAPSNIDAAVEERLARREKRASIAISYILVVLGFSVIVAALDDYAQGEQEEVELQIVVGTAFASIILFGCLAAIKFKFAKVLDSASLYKDGICSLIGIACSAGLFVNSLIIQSHPGAWWVDPSVAMIAGVFAIVYGIYGVLYAVFVEKLPICSCKWWFFSKGETAEPSVSVNVSGKDVEADRETAVGSDGEESEIV